MHIEINVCHLNLKIKELDLCPLEHQIDLILLDKVLENVFQLNMKVMILIN